MRYACRWIYFFFQVTYLEMAKVTLLRFECAATKQWTKGNLVNFNVEVGCPHWDNMFKWGCAMTRNRAFQVGYFSLYSLSRLTLVCLSLSIVNCPKNATVISKFTIVFLIVSMYASNILTNARFSENNRRIRMNKLSCIFKNNSSKHRLVNLCGGCYNRFHLPSSLPRCLQNSTADADTELGIFVQRKYFISRRGVISDNT